MNIIENEDLVFCGGIIVDGEVTPLYTSKETGSVVYVDELNQEVLTIGGMGCEDPIELGSVESVVDALKEDFKGCLGVVYSASAVLVVKNETKLGIIPLGGDLSDEEAEISITVGVESEIPYEDLEN